VLHIRLDGEDYVVRDVSWLDPTIVDHPHHVVKHDLMKKELIGVLSS
jgi:hypothetical protein